MVETIAGPGLRRGWAHGYQPGQDFAVRSPRGGSRKQAVAGGLSCGPPGGSVDAACSALRHFRRRRPLQNPPRTPKSDVVVLVHRIVVVAVRTAQVVRVVVPRAAPQHAFAGGCVPAGPNGSTRSRRSWATKPAVSACKA